ncbi:hypothetical protein MNB_SV-10-459 [hydrothermal vent metagenome]|uniref:Uncharacterized protein n=1 Tax=hydrothermal vent metagenome TaxID=652676 RepID=A0A1W1BTC4_9ZZZZ
MRIDDGSSVIVQIDFHDRFSFCKSCALMGMLHFQKAFPDLFLLYS